MILHAGLIALRLDGQWRGALIEGPSGVGKSDLTLRALENGFRLVSDDRTLVWASGGSLYGRAPEALAGLIESRGQGVLAEAALAFAQVILAVACLGSDAEPDRIPEPSARDVAGIAVANLRLNPREPSACAKLRRALRHLGGPGQQAYQATSLGGGGRAGTGDTE